MATLFIAFTIVVLIATAGFVNAQSVAVPSEPQFSLNFTHSGFSHVSQNFDNNTLTVQIENQPLAYPVGANYQLFYNIRIKNHSAADWQWTELYPIGTYYEKEFTSYLQKPLDCITSITPNQSSTEYTNVALNYYNPPFNGQGISFPLNFNSTVDVQVKALVGHSSEGWVADVLQSPVLGGRYTTVMALNKSSNWSSTQTIIIPVESTEPNPTPTVPEYPLIAVFLVMLASFVIATKFKKQTKWMGTNEA
jgi:hypothetical protein